MPARAPEATCQGAPIRTWTRAATAALAATVTSVTRPRAKPAISPMKSAVKAKSAPKRAGSPRNGAERGADDRGADPCDRQRSPPSRTNRAPSPDAAAPVAPQAPRPRRSGRRSRRASAHRGSRELRRKRSAHEHVARIDEERREGKRSERHRIGPALDRRELRAAGEYERGHQRRLRAATIPC